MKNHRKIILTIAKVFSAGFVVFSTILTINYFSNLLNPQSTFPYENAPEYLKLKAPPEDVIFSEALDTEDGDKLKYAYLTDPVETPEWEDVTRRTPVSQTEVISVEQVADKKTETLKTTFFSKPQFYEDNGVWRKIEYATTTPEVFSASGAVKYVQKREWWEKLLPGQPVFAVTSTFYPDPSVETTSVDGYVQNIASSATMATACTTARGAYASGGAGDTGITHTLIGQGIDGGYTKLCYLFRTFLLFDTSSLPDSAIITATTMSVYVTSVVGQVIYIQPYSSSPASNTAITTTDWPSVGSTAYASAILTSSLTTSAYNGFTFNSTGIAAVSLTGITKTSLRTDYDFGTFTPPADSTQNGANISSADETGTSQDPKLDVTYTSTSFSMGQWFPF